MLSFPKRPLPLNSFRSIWKNRQIDQLYSELYHPGYGKQLTDIDKLKTFFGIYHDAIINRNIHKLRDYMEPRYFNELSSYLHKTADNLEIKRRTPDLDSLKEIDVEYR